MSGSGSCVGMFDWRLPGSCLFHSKYTCINVYVEMYNYVQISKSIHIKCAFIYDSFFQLYMFCHILRSVTSGVGTSPSADRWMTYYISILNSNSSVCMKPVLPHVEQSAMSLYISRSDLWHDQTSYANAALRSTISMDRLDWRQSSKSSYCTAAWLPLITFRRRICHWKWPYMVTVRRRIDQWMRRWRRTYFLGPQGEGYFCIYVYI